MTGVEALLEVLAGAGVRYFFGNPGTTELPFSEALVGDPRFQYILALQEVPLVAMADGHAMASGRLAVVCVHISCGLGNAMGMLYNAHCEGSPLLVLAGQQDRRLLLGDPVLAGDTVGVARPWTKWAHEVIRVEDVPAAVRRAAQVALTPPTGPVFLSLPVDLQMEQTSDLDLRPPSLLDRRVRPPSEPLRRAAEMLAGAERPLILAGSRVTEADACAELGRLADLVGAPVHSEPATAHGRLPLRADHPLYAGPLPLWSPDIHALLARHDVIFVVGMGLLRLYIYHEPASPIPRAARLIHLDSSVGEIGRSHPVDVGIPGDPKCGLDELADLVRAGMTPECRRLASARREQHAASRRADQDCLRQRIEEDRDRRPMTARTLMGTLAGVLSEHGGKVAVVEEAVTTHGDLLEKLGVLTDPAAYFAHRGWALGWGLGCALGVKLAWPERPVLSLLGDGAAMYGIQGLWTAAHHRIPVTWVVANNAQYRILKQCAGHMPLPRMARGEVLEMDLVAPEIDFVALAGSLGVRAHRVSSPAELGQRLRESLAGDEPVLLDVPIER